MVRIVMSKEVEKALNEIEELKKYLKKGERLINFQIDRDNIRRYLKRIERNLKSDSIKAEKTQKLEEFAKLCAKKHVRLHYLGLPLKTYNEKVMCDERERGYNRLPLTESEYDLARRVVDEYGK